jgi:hypothetical protein
VVISSRLLPIRNAGAPSRSPRPALRRRLPSQFHFATSHVCDLRVVSAAIVLRSSVPDVWTQGCRHAGGRHAHSAGTLGLSSRLRPLPSSAWRSGSPSAISHPGNGPFSSNGPIAAFAKRFSMHSLEQLHSITQTMLKSHKQRAATTTFRSQPSADHEMERLPYGPEIPASAARRSVRRKPHQPFWPPSFGRSARQGAPP